MGWSGAAGRISCSRRAVQSPPERAAERPTGASAMAKTTLAQSGAANNGVESREQRVREAVNFTQRHPRRAHHTGVADLGDSQTRGEC
jgi:hypothetical protein